MEIFNIVKLENVGKFFIICAQFLILKRHEAG